MVLMPELFFKPPHTNTPTPSKSAKKQILFTAWVMLLIMAVGCSTEPEKIFITKDDITF
jgi:hypothetical protein